jgi:hypothetical protein
MESSNSMLGVPVWEHDGIICTGETYKAVVKMTFAKGAALADPSHLFNSSLEGNTRRAIDIHEGDRIDEKSTTLSAVMVHPFSWDVAPSVLQVPVSGAAEPTPTSVGHIDRPAASKPELSGPSMEPRVGGSTQRWLDRRTISATIRPDGVAISIPPITKT